MSVVPQWYVECDNVANEQVSALLMAQADGRESESVGKKDKEGVPHQLHRIPTNLLTLLRRAKSQQPRIYKNIRFWVEDTTEGTVRPADFLEKKKLSKKVEEIVEQAKSARERRYGSNA